MAWNFRAYAKVNPQKPEAAGICDRCGVRWSLNALQWQFEWRGPRLMNTRFRVCPKCLDVPDEHLRPIITPPDPVPVKDPRQRNPATVVPAFWDQPNLFWDGGYGATAYQWDQQPNPQQSPFIAPNPTIWDSPWPAPPELGTAQSETWDGETIPDDVWGQWK